MRSCNNNDSAAFILNAVLFSIALSKNLNSAEQNLLGTFLQEVGSNLSSMSTYEIFFEDLTQQTVEPKINPNI